MPLLMSCPNCGADLVTVSTSGHATWAPNQCVVCARGWHPSELTPAARRAWQPATRTFNDHAIAAAANADVALAVAATQQAAS